MNFFNKAKEILYNCKKSPKRGIKSFVPKSFKKGIDKDQKKYFIKCNGFMQQKK